MQQPRQSCRHLNVYLASTAGRRPSAALAPSLNWPQAQRWPNKCRGTLVGPPAVSVAHWVPAARLAPPMAPSVRLFCAEVETGAGRGRGVPFFFFLWSWQWRNQVPGGLRHGESLCPGSKLANLHPVGKYKHILDRQLIMGQDLSIGWRGGPSTLPMALHFVALDTNDEALHLFQMNQHLNYLLQNLMGRTILKFPFF